MQRLSGALHGAKSVGHVFRARFQEGVSPQTVRPAVPDSGHSTRLVPGALHDPLVVQLRDLGIGQARHIAQNLLGMLAKGGAGSGLIRGLAENSPGNPGTGKRPSPV